jgi:hypothetical protein
MAKKETDLAPTTGTAMMERPSFVANTREGTEHITQADIQIPRIVLAQKMSPEVDDSDAKRIPDLKVGDMFNGLTKEIYGRGPLNFVIVRADPPRYVEFFSREEGGGVKTPNVSPDDPRAQWGTGGEKPTATKFYDYIVLLLPVGHDPLSRMVAMSFKSTGIKIARGLNAMIQLRRAPVYAGVYQLTSVDTQNSLGKFSIFSVANAGWITDEALYNQLAETAGSMKTKTVDIDRGTDDGPDGQVDGPDRDEPSDPNRPGGM